MLSKLLVKNFALIKEIAFEPNNGFNVITGETGAGKSILLQALGLILGERADQTFIRHGAEKCVVEASFTEQNKQVQLWLHEQSLDQLEPLILRREITKQGKSRAFINDTPVSLQLLKSLASMLIDMHEQSDTSTLHARDFRYAFVDLVAGNAQLFAQYNQLISSFTEKKKTYELLKAETEKLLHEQDYLQFVFEELSQFDPKNDEPALLLAQTETLNHAEKIQLYLWEALSALERGDYNMTDLSSGVFKQLQQAARFHQPSEELSKRAQNIWADIKELSADIESESHKITADPVLLEQLESRLAQYQQLFKKHQVQDVEGLIEKKHAIQTKLETTHQSDEMISKLDNELEVLLAEIQRCALELFKRRQKVLPDIEKKINTLLKDVGMPNAQFSIVIQWEEKEMPGPFGSEKLNFWFSANKGVPAEPLSKVASGGETSRLMLCIKTLMAGQTEMPTLIFDEIDTGISGQTALKVGQVMNQLGTKHQVVAITHLPQLAAQGVSHFHISKSSSKTDTETLLIELNKEARLQEIAKMLSGAAYSENALNTAKELMEN